jgi:capsular polysaccharide transport system permease protein
MTERIRQHRFSGGFLHVNGLARRLKVRSLLRHRIPLLTLLTCVLISLYWGWIASDRYVSEARIIIQRTDLTSAQSMDFSALISGAGGTNRADQLLLRDHLLSVDMLKKLDAKLNLRAHYSDKRYDLLSRMWSDKTQQERFHKHYLSRVSVEFDDYAGVLVIKAQGYDPATAYAVTAMLVEEGERTMNAMAHQLAREQLSFVEKQVTLLAERFQQARLQVLTYQNKKGMMSPQSTVESLAGVINRLEMQRTELQARRTALLAYLAPQAPGVVELDAQLAAVVKQIAQEQARLAAPAGNTLNSTVEEYQRLEMAAMFAQDVYKTALVALEKGRVEATRTIKKVTVLQAATLPEYALQPARLYNIVVSILLSLLCAGIIHLLAAIIRDHRD